MSGKEKKSRAVKFLKFAMWFAVGTLAIVTLTVALIPLWISPVSTVVAENLVPRFTGTDFKLERFYLNPWTGALRVNGVKLSNPEGFGKHAAFSVTTVSVDVAVGTLFSNTLHVRDVTVEGTFASYFSHDGKNNFDVILDNVKQSLGMDENNAEPAEADDEPAAGESMKVIIDHIRITGTSVKITESDFIPPLPVMTIELNDIGKDSGGVKINEVGKAVSDAFMKAMGSMGDGLGALGGALNDGMNSFTQSAKNAGAATEESVKSAASAVADSTSSALSTIGDGAKSAADAVGDTTKKAAEGVKNLFKGFGK